MVERPPQPLAQSVTSIALQSHPDTRQAIKQLYKEGWKLTAIEKGAFVFTRTWGGRNE